MKHKFRWYLHDDSYLAESGNLEYLNPHLPEEVVNELSQFRPFYEIELTCEFDDITKHLTIQAYNQQHLTNA